MKSFVTTDQNCNLWAGFLFLIVAFLVNSPGRNKRRQVCKTSSEWVLQNLWEEKKIGHEQVRQRVSAGSRAKFLCRTKSDTEPPCNSLLEFFIATQYIVKGRLCNFRSILRDISVRNFKVLKLKNQRASSGSRVMFLCRTKSDPEPPCNSLFLLLHSTCWELISMQF